MAQVLTIGHSSHPIEVFIGLLKNHRVEAVADTRSHPRSKFAPQFDAEALRKSLREKGVEYLYMGKELGGRPADDGFYDTEGHVLYSRVAESGLFRRGLARLEEKMKQCRLAMLCSEENPSVCHRRLLIARVLRDRGISVAHIRGDGGLQSEEELVAAETVKAAADPQLARFEHSPVPEWKSIPSVLPRRPQNDSSAS